MKGFIYKITNQVNGKVYIGQTRQSVESRWNQHKSKARKHSDGNNYFHNAINKYGEGDFKVEILEECDFEKLDSREIYYIAKYNSFGEGYNSKDGGGGKKLIDVYNKYEEIKDLYLSGFSSNWIAVRFDVDKSTIVKILKGLGVKIRDRHFKVNNYEFNSIIEDYKSGCSLKSIAKRYDTSGATIKRKLIEKGVDIRERYELLKDEEKQLKMVEEYQNGVSASELIIQYHCEWSTFKKILSKYGIKYDTRRDIARLYKLSEKDFLKVVKMLNDGKDVKEAARKLEVSTKSIKSLLRRYHFNYPTV